MDLYDARNGYDGEPAHGSSGDTVQDELEAAFANTQKSNGVDR